MIPPVVLAVVVGLAVGCEVEYLHEETLPASGRAFLAQRRGDEPIVIRSYAEESARRRRATVARHHEPPPAVIPPPRPPSISPPLPETSPAVAPTEYLKSETLDVPTDGSEVETSAALEPYRWYAVRVRSPYNLRALVRVPGRSYGWFGWSANSDSDVLLDGVRATPLDNIEKHQTSLQYHVHGLGRPLRIAIDDPEGKIGAATVTVTGYRTDEEDASIKRNEAEARAREAAARREARSAERKERWSTLGRFALVALLLGSIPVAILCVHSILTARRARQEVQ